MRRETAPNGKAPSATTDPTASPALFAATHHDSEIDCLSANYLFDILGHSRGMKLLQPAGLLGERDAAPEFISRMDCWQICADAIILSNDEGHGLLKRPLPKGSWSVLYTAVNQMENLGEGLKRFVELVPILQCGVEVSLGYCSRYAHLSFRASDDIAPASRIDRYLEIISTVFLCALNWGAEREFLPEKFTLSTELDPAHGSLAGRLSHTGIEQDGRGARLSFRLSDLDIRLGARKFQSWGTHETTVYRRMLFGRDVAPAPESEQIVSEVRRLLETGLYGQDNIARRLGVGLSTLQRRLALANTSFRQLSKDVRSHQLATLLATSGDLDDIAREMGFSDRRSLTRACQDWLGETPTGYRKRYAESRRLDQVTTVSPT